MENNAIIARILNDVTFIEIGEVTELTLGCHGKAFECRGGKMPETQPPQ